MNHSLSEMSEEEVKDALIKLKELHNSLIQQAAKVRERVSIFQAQLLQLQEERFINAKLHILDTTDLERETGCSRREIIKALLQIKKEEENNLTHV